MNPLHTHIALLPASMRKQLGGQHRQHGSVVVMAAIFLSIMVILLSSIDIGYVFYMKRDLQKVADLAALAGAQQLVSTPPAGNPTACASTDQAVLAAIGNAQSNGFSTAAPNSMSNAITVTCGLWDPVANASLAPSYFAAPSGGAKLNAVKVIATQNVPAFFGLGTQTISGQAIASGASPTAAFSLGTGLLSLCSGSSPILGPLVNSLLGSKVCLSVATYAGLVGTQVSLLKVLENLNVNVGTVGEVANTSVSLANLVNATIQALSPTQAANIGIAALQQDLVNLTTGTLGVTMLKISDILDLGAANGVAALDTQINVLDLLNVSTLQAANKNNFLSSNVNVDLGPLGLVGLQLSLIEPPKMAVGGEGATATSAQLRLALNVQALKLAPGYSVANLPLYIDLAPGTAKLTSLQCHAPQSATFEVRTGIAEACLAHGQNFASAPFSCPKDMATNPSNRVDVISGVLNAGINVSLTNPPPSSTVTLNPPPATTNSVTVGSSLQSILGGVITGNTLWIGLDPFLDPTGLLGAVLNPLVGLLGTLLTPILSGVGALLDNLTSLLGLNLGLSTLNLSSVSCGSVKLVY